MFSSPVYLDHNATTPVREEVLGAMWPWFTEKFGNASSIHGFGREAAAAVDDARGQVASLLSARPQEIVFTSGGTESDNTAVTGVMRSHRARGRHLITTQVEHKAVLDPCRALQRLEGCEITFLPVDGMGRLDPEDLRRALRPDTVLVSVMMANNETGNLHPLTKLAELTHASGALFHTDAVNALGKVPVDVSALGVDLLSLSGHKFHAPKGIGALYIRRGVTLEPLLLGGGQEKGKRCGTYNTPGIVGLGAASQWAMKELAEVAPRLQSLRNQLEDEILRRLSGVWVNGDPSSRLPNTTNLGFAGLEGEALLMSLDLMGVATSTGSACSSGSLEPSHVLLAMGQDREKARCTLRFSLGRDNTKEQIEGVVDAVVYQVNRLRAFTS